MRSRTFVLVLWLIRMPLCFPLSKMWNFERISEQIRVASLVCISSFVIILSMLLPRELLSGSMCFRCTTKVPFVHVSVRVPAYNMMLAALMIAVDCYLACGTVLSCHRTGVHTFGLCLGI